MKSCFFFRYVIVFLLLVTMGAVLEARAVEIFTVGGSERPWAKFGTTPGGVIGFVDRLGEVQDVSGEQVFEEVADSLMGWIMPLRLRSGFNISLGILERGGSITVPNLAQVDQDELDGMLSGDPKVAFDRKFVEGRIVINNGIKFRIDLGARFGVNRIVFYPRNTPEYPFGNDFLRGYELFLNDGLPQNLFGSGQPIFTSPVAREADNSDTTVVADIEPQFVRYIELKSITTLGFEIDEIEIYGTGFVPVANYVSEVLDLGEEVVWGAIEWTEQSAGRGDDSRVEVRVRSGRDTTPDIYYRAVALGGGKTQIVPTTSEGDTLTQATYEKLRVNEQGPITVDVKNWSQWQIVASGEDLSLPAPRRYFQFRIDFSSQNLKAARAIDDLSFEFVQPPVDRIVAEVGPSRTEPGVLTTFTYITRITNATGRPGFERFEIETPSRVTSIKAVEIMDEGGGRLSGAEFESELDTSQLPIRVGGFAIEEVEDDHFTLGLPRIVADGTLLKIVFDAAVFRYGTRFQGRAFADETAELPLLTEGGNASPELDTDGLLVRVSLGSKVAGSLEIHPAVFTPNGDGVNDVAEVTFTVLHLLQPSPVEVDIYDLAGRRVRRLSAARVQNGHFPLLWDGRGDDGGVVPPGLYLIEVEIHSDQRTERRVGRVTVVY